MALQIGARIGVLEVVAAIGAGGMGEVYRARDTRLNRDVAVKIVSDLFAADADRLARFTREAQTLASLNHSNIAAIYGFEEQAGVRALVMEFVDGEDLSQRLARGPVPLDEAVSIANQIANALAAAHEQGIVHRDLKPANVKVRPDGVVKVLDFGLAKAMEPPGSSVAVSQSPTITTPAMMTGVGMILGSAAYMSPEQARGKTVDKRSDIWAFGCVLYEMLSGRRAFDAEDVSMTLASVMMKEPDWNALPDDVPAHLRTVIRRCLEKDRQKRLADIAVAQFLINEPPAAAAGATPAVVQSAPLRRATLTRALAIALAAIAAVSATAGITWWLMRPPTPQPVRFTITPPLTQPLTVQGFQRDIAITPDGRTIIYRVGPAGTIGTQLAIRALDQLEARVLPGITGIRSPFVSPDGHSIGFFEGANGELKRVSLQGGPPIALCRYVGNPYEASWAPDNTIVFATSDITTGLMSVSAAGGVPKVLTKPDATKGEGDHVMPFVLPGGRGILFTITRPNQLDASQIAVFDPRTGEKKILIRGGTDARYVDTGHLIYATAGTLRAVLFDLGRLEVMGEPVPVLDQLATSGTTGTADYAIAQNGTLVYVPGVLGSGVARTLAWVRRDGREEPINNAPARAFVYPRVSPDGTRVALDARDQESDIWIWDLKRETLARLTFDPGQDQSPVWTPDSRRIIFGSPRGGAQNLYWQAADNTGTVERLNPSPNIQLPYSVSSDGKYLVFGDLSQATNQDIGVLTLPADVVSAATPSARPLIRTMFNEGNAELSPDGRWVAYQSNESGANEIYVRPFPNADAGRWQISNGGGTRPVWARNGRELFFYSNTALMTVATSSSGTTFSAGHVTKLFDTAPYYFLNAGRTYDVAADGRFLMIKTAQSPNSTASSFVVVEHWTEELKTRTATQ